MAIPPRVYAVIVNFRRADDTVQCLKSLHRLHGADLRVILVENGSGDTSAAQLTKWIDEQAKGVADSDDAMVPRRLEAPAGGGIDYTIQFLASDQNLGFAGGCNLGIRTAMADTLCDYVWLLNNDTLAEPDALISLIRRFDESDSIGMCGSTLVYYAPADRVQACGGQFNLMLGRGAPIGAHYFRDTLPEQADVERDMDYVVGASMLVSRTFIEKVGEMEARYFLYFEELDWAMRGKAAGFSLGWAPRSVVIHKEGAAIGTSTQGRPSDLSIYFMTASYLRLIAFRRPALMPLALARCVANAVRWRMRKDKRAMHVTLNAIATVIKSPGDANHAADWIA